MKSLYYRGIRIEKYAQSRYAISQGEDVFRFASYRGAIDFANFICEDKERERQAQITRLQESTLDFKTFEEKKDGDKA